MDRINDPSAPNRRWVAKDPNITGSGTIIKKDWLQSIDDELINLIEKAGLVPNGADVEQVYKAILKIATNQVAPLYNPFTLYVASTGNDSTGTGTPANPFLTIAAAVNKVPMGGYADIAIADTVNSGQIDVKNRAILINRNGSRKRVNFNGVTRFNNGFLSIDNLDMNFSNLPENTHYDFAFNGSGVLQIGGYSGSKIVGTSSTKPLCLLMVDYASFIKAHIYLGRVSKSITNAIYARGSLYAGTVSSEIWQCVDINDSY